MAVNRFRILSPLALSAVLALSIAVPVSSRTGEGQAASAGTQTAPQGQARQGPRRNRNPTELGWEWWRDPAVVQELGLRPDKVKRIEGYYNNRQRELKPMVDAYWRELEILGQMTEERIVDFTTYSLQVKKAEMLRSDLNESRTLMLYRIYLVLEPAQYQKLRDIFDRRSRRGRGGQ